MKNTLQDYIEAQIDKLPETVTCHVITSEGIEHVTNRELIDKAKSLGDLLTKIEFQEKCRAIILSENSINWFVCYLGVLFAGGVAVTIDTELLPANTTELIAKMDPVIIFCSKSQYSKLSDQLPVPVIIIDRYADMLASLSSHTHLVFDEENQTRDYDQSVASIVNSSGTGGSVKGILLTHQNLLDVVKFYENQFTQSGLTQTLCILPCFTIYACSIVLASLASGKSIYFADVKKLGLMNILKQQPVQFIPLVPLAIMAMHNVILENVSKLNLIKRSVFKFMTKLSYLLRRYLKLNVGRILFSSIHRAFGNELKVIATGGAPLNAVITQDFYSWGFTIIEGYGLTETAGVISTTDGHYKNIGSCGKLLPNLDIIIDQPDHDGCGEIFVKSPRLMYGYFRDSEANQQSYSNGYFHTGDLGKFDNNGNLCILGRKKEIIIGSDERKTLPEDVELNYQSLPGIVKLAVVGIIDEASKSDVIHAAIVPDAGLINQYHGDINQIKAHLEKIIINRANQLPLYLQINKISLFDKIPINALGKTKRAEIRNIIMQSK